MSPVGPHGLEQAESVEKTVVEYGNAGIVSGHQRAVEIDQFSHDQTSSGHIGCR